MLARKQYVGEQKSQMGLCKSLYPRSLVLLGGAFVFHSRLSSGLEGGSAQPND